jgi:serine/threonine protein kinase
MADHPDLWANDPVKALEFFAEICDGLAHAHAQDPTITHRDIKPANILLATASGPPIVADFGICHVADGERLTLIDEAVGARRFTPPEMEDGRADLITPRSDVYSLGKLLYWMLNGGSVFDREKHRDQRYDLTRGGSRPEYEHVNELLDRMIVAEPSKRLTHAGKAAEGAREMARRIRLGARPLAIGLPQPCGWCQRANYVHAVEGEPNDANNFGLRPVGNPEFHLLVCPECGHVEMFRADLARNPWLGPRRLVNFTGRLR